MTVNNIRQFVPLRYIHTRTHTHIYIYMCVCVCVCQYSITNIVYKYLTSPLYHCHNSILNVPKIESEYVGGTVMLQKGCNSMVSRQEITVHQVLVLYG